MEWLLTTSLGRSLLGGLAITVGILIGWGVFSKHYRDAGYEACQVEHRVAQAKADKDQKDREDARDKSSAAITQSSDKQAGQVTHQVDEQTNAMQETTHEIYREPPKTEPVVRGSCVHPVDPRVQAGIDQAVDAANRAGRPL